MNTLLVSRDVYIGCGNIVSWTENGEDFSRMVVDSTPLQVEVAMDRHMFRWVDRDLLTHINGEQLKPVRIRRVFTDSSHRKGSIGYFRDAIAAGYYGVNEATGEAYTE